MLSMFEMPTKFTIWPFPLQNLTIDPKHLHTLPTFLEKKCTIKTVH